MSAERLNCCFWWQFQALHPRQILYKYMQKRTWEDFQGEARQCKGERRELRWLQDNPCRKKPLCVWCECGSKWTACAEAPQGLLANLKQQSLLQNQKPTSLNCSLVVSSLRKRIWGREAHDRLIKSSMESSVTQIFWCLLNLLDLVSFVKEWAVQSIICLHNFFFRPRTWCLVSAFSYRLTIVWDKVTNCD